jgi:hypothetical protein
MRIVRPHALALLLVPLLPAPCYAVPDEHADGQAAIIAGDYFAAGAHVSLVSPVDGDAFIAAARMDLNRSIKGDALLAGGRISVSDRVGGSVYATGANVTIDAPVAGNARLAGSHVEISKFGRVFGKTTLVGARILMLGTSGGQLVMFGEQVTLDGEVEGNVTIAARTLSIGPNARVAGKLTYRGALPAQIAPGALIAGGMSYLSFDFEDETFQPVARVIAWIGAIAFTIGLFLIGMLAIIVAPQSTARISTLGRRRPIASIALGLVAVVCVPVASLLLMLSVVGLPIALMLALMWPMALIFGYLAGVMTMSDAIAGPSADAKGRRIFLLAMGLGVMLLFARVPFAGWMIGMILLIMGVGAMALNAMGASVPVRVKKEKRAGSANEPGEAPLRQEPTLRLD